MPDSYIEKVYFYLNIVESIVIIRTLMVGEGKLSAGVFYAWECCGRAQTKMCAGNAVLTIALSNLYLWEAGHGRLYDVRFTFEEDCVERYFGMCEIRFDGGVFFY